jgi:signal peptidase I
MNSNFYNKEFILVNRLTTINLPFIWKIDSYKRWDVIVFEPRDLKEKLINHINWIKEEDNIISKIRRFIAWPKITYIKRIIWLPWDTIRIKDWLVFVKKAWEKDFEKLNEKYLNSQNLWNTNVLGSEWQKDFLVPKWKYFVMWDNRINSSDSRICFSDCSWDNTPFVDEKYIFWKVWFDLGYFNFKKFSFDNESTNHHSIPRFLDFPKNYTY